MSRYGGPEQMFCKMRVFAHEQMFIIIFFSKLLEGGHLPLRVE